MGTCLNITRHLHTHHFNPPFLEMPPTSTVEADLRNVFCEIHPPEVEHPERNQQLLDFWNLNDLRGITYVRTPWRGTNNEKRISCATLTDVNLQRSNFAGIFFSNCEFVNVDFSHADLRGAHFFDCTLRGVKFSHANVRGFELRCCDMKDLNFFHADMRGAWLRSLDGILPEEFANADLRGADLSYIGFGLDSVYKVHDYVRYAITDDTTIFEKP